MNPATACATSLLRAFIIAALATLVAYPICTLLKRTGSRAMRRVAWVLLLCPFLTPGLVVGYAYADFKLSLVHHPVLNQGLYLLLVLLRLTPVAVLAVLFAPAPPLSAEAVYCDRLLRRGEPGSRGWWAALVRPLLAAGLAPRVFSVRASNTRGASPAANSRLGIISRGPARIAATAFALTFLLAFQEFDVSSLLNIQTWTVWLFDAQAGGLDLNLSVLYALPPFFCEVAVLLPVAAMLLGRGRRIGGPGGAGGGGQGSVRGRLSPGVRVLVWLYLVTALGFVTVIPSVTLVSSAWAGFHGLLTNFPLGGPVRASLLFGAAASVAAYLAARGLRLLAAGLAPRVIGVRASNTRGASPAANSRATVTAGLFLVALSTAPGLFGALIVSLTTQYLFQRPVLHHVYNTPLPLLLAMALLLMAPAVLLVTLFDNLLPAPAAHAAELLLDSADRARARAGIALLWDLRIQPQLWVVFLLFFLGYFDLTSAALLAPSNLMPATVLLFNLMHYGRTAPLSAGVCFTLAVPVMLLLVIGSGRWWGSWLAGWRPLQWVCGWQAT